MEKFGRVSVIEELIFSCENLFKNDALVDLREKLEEFVSNAKGLVLPIYCNEEEDNFWLFYYPDSVSNLQEKGPKHKLVGYWLDHESTTTYKLLNEKVTIIGENIIKDNERVFFEVHKFDDGIQSFDVNKSFEKKIEHVLSQKGYM